MLFNLGFGFGSLARAGGSVGLSLLSLPLTGYNADSRGGSSKVVTDYRGIPVTAGADIPAVTGARYTGTEFVATDTLNNQLLYKADYQTPHATSDPVVEGDKRWIDGRLLGDEINPSFDSGVGYIGSGNTVVFDGTQADFAKSISVVLQDSIRFGAELVLTGTGSARIFALGLGFVGAGTHQLDANSSGAALEIQSNSAPNKFNGTATITFLNRAYTARIGLTCTSDGTTSVTAPVLDERNIGVEFDDGTAKFSPKGYATIIGVDLLDSDGDNLQYPSATYLCANNMSVENKVTLTSTADQVIWGDGTNGLSIVSGELVFTGGAESVTTTASGLTTNTEITIITALSSTLGKSITIDGAIKVTDGTKVADTTWATNFKIGGALKIIIRSFDITST